jgi:hypothetical protein
MVFLCVPRAASATFLGLTRGDYDVVLHGSAVLCGSNCLGTVHVPITNASLSSDFDWSFEIAGLTFD